MNLMFLQKFIKRTNQHAKIKNLDSQRWTFYISYPQLLKHLDDLFFQAFPLLSQLIVS